MESRFGNANHWCAGQLAGGVQAGITKAGDDVGVGCFALASQNFFYYAQGADRLIEMAFNGYWATAWLRGGNACAGRRYGLGGTFDGRRHGLGSIGVYDANMH